MRGRWGEITSSSDVPIEIKCAIGYKETTNKSSTQSPSLHFQVIWCGDVCGTPGSEDKWIVMLTQMPCQV